MDTASASNCSSGCMPHTAQITIRDQRSNEELSTSRNRFSIKYAG
ncbi:MAG: hypothetical protein QE493_07700 [Verrucomicrobiae bacterium]|nr:hypothetical protein [Verrucomicrobiae bacterium]